MPDADIYIMVLKVGLPVTVLFILWFLWSNKDRRMKLKELESAGAKIMYSQPTDWCKFDRISKEHKAFTYHALFSQPMEIYVSETCEVDGDIPTYSYFLTWKSRRQIKAALAIVHGMIVSAKIAPLAFPSLSIIKQEGLPTPFDQVAVFMEVPEAEPLVFGSGLAREVTKLPKSRQFEFQDGWCRFECEEKQLINRATIARLLILAESFEKELTNEHVLFPMGYSLQQEEMIKPEGPVPGTSQNCIRVYSVVPN